MNNLKGGNGRLLGGVSGVPAASVAIWALEQWALMLPKRLWVSGLRLWSSMNLSRLQRLKAVQHPLNTSIMQPSHLRTALGYCDVAIGAVRSQKGRTPCVVSEQMVQQMKAGSVIVDVSIDQGGVLKARGQPRPSDLRGAWDRALLCTQYSVSRQQNSECSLEHCVGALIG